MSPTVFRHGPFRFFFFSREESRMHIHVLSPEGEAKYWMDPEIELAGNHGFGKQDLLKIRNLIKEHNDVIRRAWTDHFGD